MRSRSGTLPPPIKTDNLSSSSSSNYKNGARTNRSDSLYRKHTRKQSSQIIVPPLGTGSPIRVEAGDSSTTVAELLSHPPSSRESPESEDLDRSPVMEINNEDSSKSVGGNHNNSGAPGAGSSLALGASFLIGAQFFAKLLTFTLNQAILRFVSPEIVGFNAQLELLITTILLFAREPIRLACQRQSLDDKHRDIYLFEGGVIHDTRSGTIQEVVNLGFIPLVVGTPLALLLSSWFYWRSNYIPHSATAVMIISLSSVIELLAEPNILFSQLQLQFKTRASIESISITIRCVLTFITVSMDRRDGAGIVAFALGQLAYSTVLAALYVVNGIRLGTSSSYTLFYPQAVSKNSDNGTTKIYFNPQSFALAQSLWAQTIIKHFLSEGDKLLISAMLPIADQGVYAIVSNYGSLIARLVFLPIEEAIRNVFSKVLAVPVARSHLDLSISLLSNILRLYSYLALFAFTFGPNVAPFILRFLISSSFINKGAPQVLAVYTCYVPFMAINGAVEAFVQSVASTADIKRQRFAMVLFSATFAIVSLILMKWLDLGPVGLVYANITSMFLRIIWCYRYIKDYYLSHGMAYSVWMSLPKPLVLSSFAICAPCIWYFTGIVDSVSDLLLPLIMVFVLGLITLYSERVLISQALDWRQRQTVKKNE